MNAIFLMLMIFLHIVDDYYLQGILAKLKQKDWWQENAPDKMYRNDYKMALAMHGFSWSFMIHLPLMVILTVGWMSGKTIGPITITFSVLGNACIHAFIDNLKANAKCISLVADQIVHIIQIVIVWMLFLARA